ncbi:MAG: hypothetical protein NVSMB52_12400 [Chloroflexota bacterium]
MIGVTYHVDQYICCWGSSSAGILLVATLSLWPRSPLLFGALAAGGMKGIYGQY